MKKTVSALLVFPLLVAACSRSCGQKQVSSATETFYWNNYAEPGTLDPGLAQDSASSNVIFQLYEGLTEYEPRTLEPLPGVATRWEVSPDGLVYTFYLRNNARWSDDSPVTARDFEYSWKRVLDPKTASQYAYILYFIEGAEAYNTGKTIDAGTVGVKSLDDLTLQVTLKHPTPFFPQVVAFYTYRPVQRKTVEQWGDRWTRPEHFVGNGAYRLTRWVPQKEVVVEKNTFYWDQENVQIEKIVFLPVEERETALKLHLQGKVHYSEDLPFLKIPELRKHPHFIEGPELVTYYYQLNTKKKPLDDLRVRRALTMAIDRKVITDFLKKGDHPTTHLTPDGIKGYVPPEGPGFDPKEAKKLLTDAGFADPKTFPKLAIAYNTSENHKAIAELIQNMWKTHLGVEMSLQNYEWKVLYKIYETKDYDIGRMGWIGDYADPYTFLTLLTTSSQQNNTQWSNPVYDDLVLNVSAKETDLVKRNAFLAEAEKMLLEDVPLIPIYHYNRPALLDPRVKGFYINLRQTHPMKFVSFAK